MHAKPRGFGFDTMNSGRKQKFRHFQRNPHSEITAGEIGSFDFRAVIRMEVRSVRGLLGFRVRRLLTDRRTSGRYYVNDAVRSEIEAADRQDRQQSSLTQSPRPSEG